MEITHYICERRKIIYTPYWVNHEERQEIIRDCGANGLLAYEYYLYMARQTKDIRPITDEATAHWFGWEVHTAGRARRKLIKHGWYLRIKPPKKGNLEFNVYYLGKQAVAEAKGTA